MSEMKLWKCEKCWEGKPCYAYGRLGNKPQKCVLHESTSDWKSCDTHRIVEVGPANQMIFFTIEWAKMVTEHEQQIGALEKRIEKLEKGE